jgi:hypothetical protein
VFSSFNLKLMSLPLNGSRVFDYDLCNLKAFPARVDAPVQALLPRLRPDPRDRARWPGWLFAEHGS